MVSGLSGEAHSRPTDGLTASGASVQTAIWDIWPVEEMPGGMTAKGRGEMEAVLSCQRRHI